MGAKVATTVAAGVISFVVASAAFAAQAPITLTIRPGSLNLVTAPAQALAAGPNRQRRYAFTITVVDARGNGHGWSLFARTAAPVMLVSAQARCGTHSTCTLPNVLAIPFSLSAGTPTAVVSAGVGGGMGIIQITVVATPADAGRHESASPHAPASQSFSRQPVA